MRSRTSSWRPATARTPRTGRAATSRRVPGAEAPPTPYGAKNAAEDMCESFGIYVADKDRLKNGDGKAKAGEPGNACPKRYAFCEAVIAGWTPKPKPPKAPKKSWRKFF